jgi:hypothetical protein
MNSLGAPALPPPTPREYAGEGRGRGRVQLSSVLTSQCDIGGLAAVVFEHEIHKVLRAWQGVEAGPTPYVVQQGSQNRARAVRSPCLLSFLQQLRDIYTGLGRRKRPQLHPQLKFWSLALSLLSTPAQPTICNLP